MIMKKYQFTKEQRALMEKAQIPFAIYQFVDGKVVTLILSQGFCDLFGYDNFEEAYYDMDNDMYKDAHSDDITKLQSSALAFAKENKIYNVVYRSKNRNGSGYNIIHAMGEHIYTSNGTKLAQVWYTYEGPYLEDDLKSEAQLNRDFSEVLQEDSMIKVNAYDYLTGLPSMTHFFELAEAGRNEMSSKNIDAAMMFFDFSGMKFYNSKYGFSEGDRLLRSFAKILVKYFGEENCSRFGQDHFAAYAASDGLEEKLKQIFSDAQNINGGRTLPLRAGVYLNSMEETSAGIASDRAKIACNALRDTYVSNFNYFSDKMREVVNRKQYIIDNIDKAIEEKWIQVYYQPIVRAVNGRICDEEALARWVDPTVGVMSPVDFVPALESVKLVYKLDLYVVREVVKKLEGLKAKGQDLIHQSVNLSRYDFDSCDIVEEIKNIVDEAGIPRDVITIELTESAIGSNFEFIKREIERFKELGFSVWMDDFGSGYSSLNVLQSIKFDLIKFDVHFMRSFDEDKNSRILLQELTKMASALGITTVCEGVETEEQVKFLQEIGCSKLQGFYYSEPIPFGGVKGDYTNKKEMKFEDPKQSSYYETIGRANLYDLSTITTKDDSSMKNVYKNIPMGIVEIRGDKVRFSRSNQTFRNFMQRGFALDITKHLGHFFEVESESLRLFVQMLKNISNSHKLEFLTGKTSDDYLVNYMIRRIAFNNIKNTSAVVVAILSIGHEKEEMTYAKIANVLAKDYFNLFYVDLETGDYIEYNSKVGQDSLALARRGKNFFKQARGDALDRLYALDRAYFVSSFTKENVLESIRKDGSFNISYRLLIDEKPIYVNMKVNTLDNDNKHIIVGISAIDKQMKEKEAMEKIKQEQITYSRIMALNGDFICLYFVDPVSGRYNEYSSSEKYEEFGFAKSGEDFFFAGIRDAKVAIANDDLPHYLKTFKKDNIISDIKEKGLFILNYKMLINNTPTPVCLRATIVNENNEEKMIVGINKLSAYVVDEQKTK